MSKFKILGLTLGTALLFGYAPVASATPVPTQLSEMKAAASKSAVQVYYHPHARRVARRTTRRVVRRHTYY
jgi:hypothetical protein